MLQRLLDMPNSGMAHAFYKPQAKDTIGARYNSYPLVPIPLMIDFGVDRIFP
jgi:hypothetical protein